MIACLRSGGGVVALALVMGCGTAPPAVSELPDPINELRTALRESEQRQQQLQDEIKELKLLQQSQATKAAQTESQLRDLDAKLDMLLEKIGQLPVEVKLQMRFPGRIKGTLEEALAELSEWTTIPIRFEPGDLREAGIARFHDVELSGGDVAAGKLLADALCQTNLHPVTSLADPLLNVVYVIQNAGDPGHESLLITSRKRAAQRGKLPAEFAIQTQAVKK